jgi:hypothetical protein
MIWFDKGGKGKIKDAASVVMEFLQDKHRRDIFASKSRE